MTRWITGSRLFFISFLCLMSCQPITQSTLNQQKKITQAHYNLQLGLAYLKQGNRIKAKHLLLLALQQAPKSVETNAAMAYFFEQTGEVERAELYYKKAIAIAPNHGESLNNYGAFLCRRGDYSQAENYFIQAIDDIRYERTAAAYENAGLCAQAAQDYAKAVIFFSKALEHDPSRSQSLYELLRLTIKLGRTKLSWNNINHYAVLHANDCNVLSLVANLAHRENKLMIEKNYLKQLKQLEKKSICRLNGVNNEYNH